MIYTYNLNGKVSYVIGDMEHGEESECERPAVKSFELARIAVLCLLCWLVSSYVRPTYVLTPSTSRQPIHPPRLRISLCLYVGLAGVCTSRHVEWSGVEGAQVVSISTG